MPFVGAIIAAVVGFLGTIGTVILAIGASLLLGQIAKLFTKKPGASSLTSELASRTVTSRQAVAPWRIAYGKNRLGGIITFMSTSGSSNEFLQLVITLAGHKVSAIPNMYFDGVLVPLDGSGNATGTFAGLAHAEFNLGTKDQAAFAGLVAAVPSLWTSAYRQRGRAGVYIQLKWDQNAFPNGVPNITFDVNGKEVYDPRGGALATDNFNRASLGANWSVNSGNFAINASTDVYESSNPGGTVSLMRNTSVAPPADQYAQLTIDSLTSSHSQYIGPAIRVDSGGANTGYVALVQDNGAIILTKMVAGTQTNLASLGSGTVAQGDIIKLQAIGTSLTVYKNGALLSGLSATDSSIASGFAGVGGGGSAAGTFARGDDWSMGGAVGGAITYSENAALCIADYLFNARYGLGAQTKAPITAAMLSQSGLGAFNAANCVDADVTTVGWNTNAAVPGATLSADLGAGNSAEYRRCRIYAVADQYPGIYDVQYSDDNSIWTIAGTGFTPNVIGWNEVELAPAGAHRYWRIKLTNTPGGTITLSELEFYTSDVDSVLLQAAANTCDEQVALAAGGTESRFFLDGSFGADEKPADVIARMNSAMAGSVLYAGGKWGIYPGIWRAPTVSLGDADLRAPLKVQTRMPFRDIFNGVKGVFISPTNNWQVSDFPPYAEASWLREDANERIWRDVEYPFTISGATAQRLSKIALRRVRKQITIQGQFKLTAYQVQPLDVIQFSHPRFGWANKTFEVTACSLIYAPDTQSKAAEKAPKAAAEELTGQELAVGVDLTLRETDSTVFDWSTADENSINAPPQPVMPNPKLCQPPTSLALATGEVLRAADALRSSKIVVTWVAPADQFVLAGGHVIVQYKKSADSVWIQNAKADGAATRDEIVPVIDGTSYDVRIWAENSLGVKSTIASSTIIPTATASRSAAYTAYRPLTNPLSGHDAGANVTVSIAGFTMRAAGLDISISSGSITALAYGTLYYIYYDDPTVAGGAVTFAATTTKELALNAFGRFFVGSILTPVATGQDTVGNDDGGSGAQYGMLRSLFTSLLSASGVAGTGAITNPLNITDGNPVTSSNFSITGSSALSRAQAVLTVSPGIRGRWKSLKLKMLSQCLTNTLAPGATGASSWFAWYSWDGGTTITYLFNQDLSNGATRAFTLDVIDLPLNSNVGNLMVQIVLSCNSGKTSGAASADVFEVWIEAVE